MADRGMLYLASAVESGSDDVAKAPSRARRAAKLPLVRVVGATVGLAVLAAAASSLARLRPGVLRGSDFNDITQADAGPLQVWKVHSWKQFTRRYSKAMLGRSHEDLVAMDQVVRTPAGPSGANAEIMALHDWYSETATEAEKFQVDRDVSAVLRGQAGTLIEAVAARTGSDISRPVSWTGGSADQKRGKNEDAFARRYNAAILGRGQDVTVDIDKLVRSPDAPPPGTDSEVVALHSWYADTLTETEKYSIDVDVSAVLRGQATALPVVVVDPPATGAIGGVMNAVLTNIRNTTSAPQALEEPSDSSYCASNALPAQWCPGGQECPQCESADGVCECPKASKSKKLAKADGATEASKSNKTAKADGATEASKSNETAKVVPESYGDYQDLYSQVTIGQTYDQILAIDGIVRGPKTPPEDTQAKLVALHNWYTFTATESEKSKVDEETDSILEGVAMSLTTEAPTEPSTSEAPLLDEAPTAPSTSEAPLLDEVPSSYNDFIDRMSAATSGQDVPSIIAVDNIVRGADDPPLEQEQQQMWQLPELLALRGWYMHTASESDRIKVDDELNSMLQGIAAAAK